MAVGKQPQLINTCASPKGPLSVFMTQHLASTRVDERESKVKPTMSLVTNAHFHFLLLTLPPAVFIVVGTHTCVTTKTHKSVNTRRTSARLATTVKFCNGCMNPIIEISINCINCLCKVRYYFQYFIFINNSIKHPCK